MDLFSLLVDIIEASDKVKDDEKDGLIAELYQIFSQLDEDIPINPFISASKPVYLDGFGGKNNE